jgi:hypothetical protein
MPRLGLAVRAAQVLAGERPVGMRVHGQPLARVEQLDQQLRVDPERVQVVGAEPGTGILRDRVGQGPPVGQHGQPDRVLPEHRGGRPHPVLGLAVTGGRLAPEVGDAAAAAR